MVFRRAYAPLYRLAPPRVAWARDLIVRHFRRDARSGSPLAGLETLDIGCGAWLFAEALARLGATVEGIDPARLGRRSRPRAAMPRRRARA